MEGGHEVVSLFFFFFAGGGGIFGRLLMDRRRGQEGWKDGWKDGKAKLCEGGWNDRHGWLGVGLLGYE